MQRTCPITGLIFEPSQQEMALRAKLNVEGEPVHHPVFRLMQLGAFWQHWNLHKRLCDKTKKPIVSVYPPDCPYPVWHKDEWVKGTDPPSADFQPGQPVFPQLWNFFRKSPIAHNMGVGCENCEYTDDFWHCKHCYLCHSGLENEDIRYCYRCIHLRTSQYCVFSFESERCIDLINCHDCYTVRFAQNCWQCRDSSFLYDCRNCHDCFLCSNLRNKQFVFGNEQLTEETYAARLREWDLQTQSTYDRAREACDQMMHEQAWHRALQIDRCENVTGNYLTGAKDCTHCFFLTNEIESCVNCMRAGYVRDCLDCVNLSFKSELCYLSSGPQEQCYDVRTCIDVIQCKWMEYSAHCFQCEHCFGCCGLVGQKFHIFNQPVSPEVFEDRKNEIIATMKQTGEYGRFFPGSFAASPYQESLSGFYWPLDAATAERYGFWFRKEERPRPAGALDASSIPNPDATDAALLQRVFWDESMQRPFRIEQPDIDFCRSMHVPLPHTYYMSRIQENFRRIPFDGFLRTIACGRCTKKTTTSWPQVYDGRILCESCYLASVY